MGLDMYAYVANKANQRSEYYETAEWDEKLRHYTNPNISEPREIAYWRKHPDLHGYMEQLWTEKGMPGTGNTDADFNGVELELTWTDLENLERAITHNQLPHTEGFFFGSSRDEDSFKDLAFIVNAKAEIFLGFKVFYNSSW